MKYRVERGGQVIEIDVEVSGDACVVRGPDGERQHLAIESRPDGTQRAITPWGDFEIVSARRSAEMWADVAGRRLFARVERVRPSGQGASTSATVGSVSAPMPGKLLRLHAKVGDTVQAGQPLAVIEAMKMENELLSPVAGVITQVAVEAPSNVEKGALILTVEPQRTAGPSSNGTP